MSSSAPQPSSTLAPPPPNPTAASSTTANSTQNAGPDQPASLMECSIYQNYSASEVFVQGLAGVVNQQDVESMIRAQKKM